MLLFMDSFDHYATADLLEKWTVSGVSGPTITIDTTAGRRGSGAFRVAHSGATAQVGYCLKTVAPADATAMVGVAVTLPSGLAGASGLQVLSIRDGSLPQVSLKLNADLTLSVVRGNTTVLGTTSAAVSAGVFTHLELKVLIHNSAGTVDLRINGASALSLTGQNTRNSAVAQWTSIALGQADAQVASMSGASGKISDYDDLYVLDGSGPSPWNAFLGDCRVDWCPPTAPGATTQWIPSAGANWQCVDESAPNDDTDYTSSNVVNDVDTFVTQDAPAVGTILGVQPLLLLRKVTAGVCTVAPVVRQGGIDYPGSDVAPGVSYAYVHQIVATNPDTAAAWSIAEFNAAEFGYKRTA